MWGFEQIDLIPQVSLEPHIPQVFPLLQTSRPDHSISLREYRWVFCCDVPDLMKSLFLTVTL
jgi:hypothetical protein